jgi:hypothetical protein
MTFRRLVVVHPRMLAISYLLISMPSVAMTAEIWPDSGTTTAGVPGVRESRACPLITTDCDICITPVGSAAAVCSKRSEQCTPTKWTCLEGLGNGIGSTKRRLEFGQSHAKTLDSAVVIGPKLIHDRVPQVEHVADHENEQGVISPSRLHSPAEKPSVKKIHDRLSAEGSVP